MTDILSTAQQREMERNASASEWFAHLKSKLRPVGKRPSFGRAGYRTEAESMAFAREITTGFRAARIACPLTVGSFPDGRCERCALVEEAS